MLKTSTSDICLITWKVRFFCKYDLKIVNDILKIKLSQPICNKNYTDNDSDT